MTIWHYFSCQFHNVRDQKFISAKSYFALCHFCACTSKYLWNQVAIYLWSTYWCWSQWGQRTYFSLICTALTAGDQCELCQTCWTGKYHLSHNIHEHIRWYKILFQVYKAPFPCKPALWVKDWMMNWGKSSYNSSHQYVHINNTYLRNLSQFYQIILDTESNQMPWFEGISSWHFQNIGWTYYTLVLDAVKILKMHSILHLHAGQDKELWNSRLPSSSQKMSWMM